MKEIIIKVDDDKIDAMGGMPLLDRPQELVRCKDCKHWFPGCELLRKPMDKNDDWFCADGKRR